MSGSSYDGQPPIAERFRKLLCDGMTPADAISHLDELYHAFHFRLVRRLPEGRLRFELGAGGELVVKFNDRLLDPEKILTREPHMLEASPMLLDAYRALQVDPRQAERDALAEVMIDVPPAAPVSPEESPTTNINPQPRSRQEPRKKRKAVLRHVDWKKTIIRYGTRAVKARGRWPNANAAADEILREQDLTISRDALYEGIQNHFPDWIDVESKE